MTLEETYEYGDARDEVLSCKPGITGWWAATDRNDSTWESGMRQARELWKPSVRVPCHKHGRGSAMAKHAIESRCCSTFGMDAHARTTTVKGVPSRIFRKFADV